MLDMWMDGHIIGWSSENGLTVHTYTSSKQPEPREMEESGCVFLRPPRL